MIINPLADLPTSHHAWRVNRGYAWDTQVLFEDPCYAHATHRYNFYQHMPVAEGGLRLTLTLRPYGDKGAVAKQMGQTDSGRRPRDPAGQHRRG